MENITQDPDTSRMVRAREIPWTLEQLPRTEDTDVLALSETETVEYVRDLQQDLRIVRATLSEALSQLRTLTVACDRYRLRVRMLVEELRRANTDCQALRAEVRSLQERPAA